MTSTPAGASPETDLLVRRSVDGDRHALDELFTRHRARLERMVWLRLDRRLQGRIDPADVVQDIYLEASRRLREYAADTRVPFFIWLRSLAAQKLVDCRRRHLGAQARDVRREVALPCSPSLQASSAILAEQLLGKITTPSQVVAREEIRAGLEEAINSMEAIDREVIILRHYEQLSNSEVARELGIGESAACRRYLRALKRLKAVLAEWPGLGDTWRL